MLPTQIYGLDEALNRLKVAIAAEANDRFCKLVTLLSSLNQYGYQ